MISLLVMTIAGCSNPANVARFMGGVEDRCQTGGEWYALHGCGPADGSSDALSDAEWAATYLGHREYDPLHVQEYAARLSARSREKGGVGTTDGEAAAVIANSWWLRHLDTSVAVEDVAAKLYRRTCREVRRQRLLQGAPLLDSNGNPAFWTGRLCQARTRSRTRRSASSTSVQEGAVPRVLRARGAVGHRPELRVGHVRALDARVLQGARAAPSWCGGEAVEVRQDAHVSKREFARRARRRRSARARRLHRAPGELRVPLFEGGQSFATFSSYLRVRSGMTAINKLQCDRFAQACREIQHTLEKSPTLVYVPGRGFQHRARARPSAAAALAAAVDARLCADRARAAALAAAAQPLPYRHGRGLPAHAGGGGLRAGRPDDARRRGAPCACTCGASSTSAAPRGPRRAPPAAAAAAGRRDQHGGGAERRVAAARARATWRRARRRSKTPPPSTTPSLARRRGRAHRRARRGQPGAARRAAGRARGLPGGDRRGGRAPPLPAAAARRHEPHDEPRRLGADGLWPDPRHRPRGVRHAVRGAPPRQWRHKRQPRRRVRRLRLPPPRPGRRHRPERRVPPAQKHGHVLAHRLCGHLLLAQVRLQRRVHQPERARQPAVRRAGRRARRHARHGLRDERDAVQAGQPRRRPRQRRQLADAALRLGGDDHGGLRAPGGRVRLLGAEAALFAHRAAQPALGRRRGPRAALPGQRDALRARGHDAGARLDAHVRAARRRVRARRRARARRARRRRAAGGGCLALARWRRLPPAIRSSRSASLSTRRCGRTPRPSAPRRPTAARTAPPASRWPKCSASGASRATCPAWWAFASPRRAGTRATAPRAPTPTAGATAALPSARTRRASTSCCASARRGCTTRSAACTRRGASSCRPARPARRCRRPARPTRRRRRRRRPRSRSRGAPPGAHVGRRLRADHLRRVQSRAGGARAHAPRQPKQRAGDAGHVPGRRRGAALLPRLRVRRPAGRHLQLPAAAARGALQRVQPQAVRRLAPALLRVPRGDAAAAGAAAAAAAGAHRRLGRRAHAEGRRWRHGRLRQGGRPRARPPAALGTAAVHVRRRRRRARRVRPRVRAPPPRLPARHLHHGPRGAAVAAAAPAAALGTAAAVAGAEPAPHVQRVLQRVPP